VIFTSNRPGRSELFKQNIAEPTPELLASSSAEIKVARLMPDGKSALFSEAFQDSSGKVTLFRLPLSGGLPVPLVSGFGINNFQCARLPSHLCVFDEGRNNATVLVAYDSLTGAQHELSKLTDDPYGVDWNLSPDGSRIAIVLGERVRFLSVDSGSFYDVAVHGWMGLHGVDWSPDSQTVFLAASAPGLPGVLLQMDLHGNAHELISTLGKAPIWWGIPSPNGKYQAVLLAVGENNVWMLENF
jgi:hypothetical protein